MTINALEQADEGEPRLVIRGRVVTMKATTSDVSAALRSALS